MTIVKHVDFSTEVSKREVFSPPVLVSFQHSQLNYYIFYTLFQHFFSCVPAVFAREKFACKPMCSSTKRVVFSTVLRAFLLCSSTLFCVRFYCVPALNACKVTTFRHRFACISTVLQHFARAFQYFFACNSTVCQYFLRIFLPCSSTFCVYFSSTFLHFCEANVLEYSRHARNQCFKCSFGSISHVSDPKLTL